MKNTLSSRFTPALAAVTLSLLAFTTSAHAATTLTYSTTAPSVGGDDVYNFTGDTIDTNNDGTGGVANTDVNNVSGGGDDSTYLAGNRGPIGQTFTTGSNVLGYSLTAISLQHATYLQYEEADAATLLLRVGTFSGTALTPVYSENVTVTGTETNRPPTGFPGSGTGNFLTMTLSTPVTLAANTSYFFDLGVSAGGGFFIEMNGTSVSSTYMGGEAYHTSLNGLTMTPDTGDHVFIASMTAISAIPEPSTYGLAAGGLALVGAMVRRRRVKA
ncbi:MAG: PEP-CTERM sorting domain-containing protein [Verrucomicrobia bacterium]|nr:PEP-CTERM sorting domain-containing protein [Verrucomicrobiota bacterium]